MAEPKKLPLTSLLRHCTASVTPTAMNLFDSIIDWRKDDSAVKLKDQARIVDGKKVIKRSTKGWELCCEWRNGSTSWQSLKDLKESHPLEVAEFAYMAGIAGEPAFNWWVGWVIKKRD
jgi:hypothetical protein